MTIDKRFIALTAILAALLWAGCSSDESSAEKTESGRDADIQQIKEAMHETARRWRHGDKAVLYDQEFQYLRMGMSYNDYLNLKQIKYMESDTVENFVVTDVRFLGDDSASVDVDVIFVGPLGDTTRLPQTWMMYRDEGRWIRPTLSSYDGQKQWEAQRRTADSAAEAEQNMGEDEW